MDMQRVETLVKESAERISEKEGVKLAAQARYTGLPGDDLLTVTVAIGDSSAEQWHEFPLPGSVLRLDEPALARILDSHMEALARLYLRRGD